jgi:hypothetical protein
MCHALQLGGIQGILGCKRLIAKIKYYRVKQNSILYGVKAY